METLTILDLFLSTIILFTISLSSLSLEYSLVARSWEISRMRASFPLSSWKCSLIMETMNWYLWAYFPSSSLKWSLIMELITWYLSYASRWSFPILDWSSDIFSTWFYFFWKIYLEFLRSCVTKSSWTATAAYGSSSSLIGIWGLSGVAFDILMVLTWATGDFLFFPIFVLPNLFFFLGGILLFGLEGREFLSLFPTPARAGNNWVALPPSTGRSVLSSSYAKTPSPFLILASAGGNWAALPPSPGHSVLSSSSISWWIENAIVTFWWWQWIRE